MHKGICRELLRAGDIARTVLPYVCACRGKYLICNCARAAAAQLCRLSDHVFKGCVLGDSDSDSSEFGSLGRGSGATIRKTMCRVTNYYLQIRIRSHEGQGVKGSYWKIWLFVRVKRRGRRWISAALIIFLEDINFPEDAKYACGNSGSGAAVLGFVWI